MIEKLFEGKITAATVDGQIFEPRKCANFHIGTKEAVLILYGIVLIYTQRHHTML